MTAAAQEEVLTRGEAAARCRVSLRTLDRWAQLGIGPRPMPVGPRFKRYSSAELDRWLAECRQRGIDGGA